MVGLASALPLLLSNTPGISPQHPSENSFRPSPIFRISSFLNPRFIVYFADSSFIFFISYLLLHNELPPNLVA